MFFPIKVKRFTTLIGMVTLTFGLSALGASRELAPFAVFINETGGRIQVNVISADGKDKVILPLPPEAIEGALFAAGGYVELRTASKDMVSGRLMYSRPLPIPSSSPDFYERTTGSFYFRVVGRKIVGVKPTELTSTERKWLKERTRNGW